MNTNTIPLSDEIRRYCQHPLSALYPGMSVEELKGLTEDIRKYGQREYAVIYEDMILDGFHRGAACLELGIELKVKEFPDDQDPVAYVESKNGHRRHMTASQRALVQVGLAEWRSSGNPYLHNPAPSAGLKPVKTTQEMADAAEVSERTIRDAKKAVKQGHVDAVKDGEMSVKKAANLDKPEAPKKPSKLEKAQAKIAELKADNEHLRESVQELSDDITSGVNATESEKDQTYKYSQLRQRIRTLESQRDEQMQLVKVWKGECLVLRKKLGR